MEKDNLPCDPFTLATNDTFHIDRLFMKDGLEFLNLHIRKQSFPMIFFGILNLNFSSVYNEGLKRLRNRMLNELPYKDVVITGTTHVQVDETYPTIYDPHEVIIKYLVKYFKAYHYKYENLDEIGVSTTQSKCFIPTIPNLWFLNSHDTRQGSELKINDDIFTIETKDNKYIFPLDELKLKSKFFKTLYESEISKGTKEYKTEFSDASIRYFQDFILNKNSGNDPKLAWIDVNFDLSTLIELFELLNYFLIEDEEYGVELLKIVYHKRNSIENLREFLDEINEIVHIPNEWSKYNMFLDRLTYIIDIESILEGI